MIADPLHDKPQSEFRWLLRTLRAQDKRLHAGRISLIKAGRRAFHKVVQKHHRLQDIALPRSIRSVDGEGF